MSRNDTRTDEDAMPGQGGDAHGGEGERVTIDLGPPVAQSPMDSFAASIGTRNLLIVIITMPLVFIVVVMAIIAVFGGKADEAEIAAASTAANPAVVRSTPVTGTLSEPALSPTNVVAAEIAPEAIVLPDGAVASTMSLDGERLAVRIDGPDGAAIIIYDLGLGAVVQTVPITAGDAN